MQTLLGNLLEDLQNLGVESVGVDVGDDNRILRRRRLVLWVASGTAPPEEVRARLSTDQDVVWQGESWRLEGGIVTESGVEKQTTHTIYRRGEGISLEALFESCREMWLSEVADEPINDVAQNKRFRFRVRELREKSNHQLSIRMAQVYALDEIGRSTEDVAEILNMSTGNIERRRDEARERLGSRYGNL